MPQIDIYRLSRLAFADITGWQRIVKELQRTHRYAFMGYAPFRKAAIRLLSLGDRDEDTQIVADMRQQSSDVDWAARNERAYRVFKRHFSADLQPATEVYMGRWGEFPELPFSGDVALLGGPHFCAPSRQGRLKHVYLHASRDWSQQETEAFCELLCYVSRERFGARPSDVWFLDAAEGTRVRHIPKKRVLGRCKSAAELLFSLSILRDL